jgi:hypothetical protein
MKAGFALIFLQNGFTSVDELMLTMPCIFPVPMVTWIGEFEYNDVFAILKRLTNRINF